MKGITAVVLATAAVIYSLMALLSADRSTPRGTSALVNTQEKISDSGSRLLETLMLYRHQQQLREHGGTASVPETADSDRIMKVQQALKDDGFYSGPVDGLLRQSTREAIRSFQQAKHLSVTGTVDGATTRELGLQ